MARSGQGQGESLPPLPRAGLEETADLRDYLLASPEVLLVDARSIGAAAQVLEERCGGDRPRAQAALQQLLRWAGRCLGRGCGQGVGRRAGAAG